MISPKAVLLDLVGLFVDDGSLALAALAWLVFSAFLIPLLGLPEAWRAIALFLGFAAILVENVTRSARRSRR
ncbi:MAG: hypothetical protein ACOY3L_07000 [Pseudomonadota bacterium]